MIGTSTSRSLTSDDWGRLASSGPEGAQSVIPSVLSCVESTSCHGRPYGTRSEDVSVYGNIPPCRFHGWIRCIESNELSIETISKRPPIQYHDSYRSQSAPHPLQVQHYHPPKNSDYKTTEAYRFDLSSRFNVNHLQLKKVDHLPELQHRSKPEPARPNHESSHIRELQIPQSHLSLPVEHFGLQEQRMTEHQRRIQSNQIKPNVIQHKPFGHQNTDRQRPPHQIIQNNVVASPRLNQPTQGSQLEHSAHQLSQQKVDFPKDVQPGHESRSAERSTQANVKNPSSPSDRELNPFKQWSPQQPHFRFGTSDQRLIDPLHFNENSSNKKKPFELQSFGVGNQRPSEPQQRSGQFGNQPTEVIRPPGPQMSQQQATSEVHQRSETDFLGKRLEFVNSTPKSREHPVQPDVRSAKLNERIQQTALPQHLEPREPSNTILPSESQQEEFNPRVTEFKKTIEVGPSERDESALQPFRAAPQFVEPAKSSLERLLERESEETQQQLAALIRTLALEASRGKVANDFGAISNRSPTLPFESNVVPFIPFADPLPLEPPSNALF